MNPIVKMAGALGLVATLGMAFAMQQWRLDNAVRQATGAKRRADDLEAALTHALQTPKIITEYVDRVQVVRERGATVVKEIPVHVTAEDDGACRVPDGFVRLHDAAATNVSVDNSRHPDARTTGPALSDVATTVIDNYTACHINTAQLNALRATLRSMVENAASAP